VEHRFYGKSQPLGDYSDLELLSVDQALVNRQKTKFVLRVILFDWLWSLLDLVLFCWIDLY
jgi:hypothetical protein